MLFVDLYYWPIASLFSDELRKEPALFEEI